MKKVALGLILLMMSFRLELAPDSAFLHTLYLTSSCLSDPIVATHRLATKLGLIDLMYPEESLFARAGKKLGCTIGTLVCSTTSIGTLLPNIGVRHLANCLAKESYCYRRGACKEQEVETGEVSLLSWNVCGITGGYVYTSGGVLPWWERLEAISEKIAAYDADIVCLYEVFDVQMAEELMRIFDRQYAHFYFNMGNQACGFSSGLFVASKLKIDEATFNPFTCEEMGEKHRLVARGFFSGHVEGVGDLVATHLQHSSHPDAPEEKEVKARYDELSRILGTLEGKQRVILTGDFNICDHELSAYHLHEEFMEEIPDGGCTWGGTCFCKRPLASPMNLDHTLVKGGTAIHSTLVETGYERGQYKESALSDHQGVYSRILF